MSKKSSVESFQVKITRNDRFAQMSHQEKVIEQKKKEIQAKLEQKAKGAQAANDSNKSTTTSTSPTPSNAKQNKSTSKTPDPKKPTANFNMFSNDGSFLDQFKQMKEKKLDQKLKSFKRDNQERISFSDDRKSRWSQRRRSPSPKDRLNKSRMSRFSEKLPNFEPKISINTTYSNLLSQTNFDMQQTQVPVNTQNVTGQPLLKNIVVSTGVTYSTPVHTTAPVIVAPPILLNVPPPQVLQPQMSTSLVVPPPPSLPAGNVLISTTNVVTAIQPQTVLTQESAQQVVSQPPNAVSIPPPCIATVELSSIPPPNPIQVHNIPQPEPINTLNIPPPAPIQVQNIPPPSPIQLNEIPNPKPIDLMNIPTPGDSMEKGMSDPDFIKNVPPPNKSVPPPSLSEVSINVGIPPPAANMSTVSTCLPPPSVALTSMPPPQQTVQQTLSLPPPQNVLVHTVPPPQQLQQITTIQGLPHPSQQTLSTIQTLPPPPPPPQSTLAVTIPLQTQMQAMQASSGSNSIPSLMAQPILPPPGMGLAPHININCPPPTMQNPPPSFVNQPPPMTSQMPPMNVPPPAPVPVRVPTPVTAEGNFKDLNAGSADYEAMASLARMVAQCGPGFEDIVRQRKPQDPSLWFLFNKESAPYKQYQQLIEQFKREMGKIEIKKEAIKPEDIYEPEMAVEDDVDGHAMKQEIKTEIKQEPSEGGNCESQSGKRKRRSRWGDKDTSVPPPVVLNAPITNAVELALPSQVAPLATAPTSGSVMLTKVNRNDPALIQYAMNAFGSANLSEEDWKKAEDHFKINLLYQDMLRKRQEVERLQKMGKNKYEYDSDEETDGGTWEHKLREKEMLATQLWAAELTKQAEGKHHIGDFLPPEELKRFMEKSSAAKEGRQPNISDYKDFKLKEDNIGFKMLQKLGWSEGQGLGSKGSGIVEPVNKATVRDHNQGLGLEQPDALDNNDDEYDAYRKRMMLAYRFRPNPLNNPRRPYY